MAPMTPKRDPLIIQYLEMHITPIVNIQGVQKPLSSVYSNQYPREFHLTGIHVGTIMVQVSSQIIPNTMKDIFRPQLQCQSKKPHPHMLER